MMLARNRGKKCEPSGPVARNLVIVASSSSCWDGGIGIDVDLNLCTCRFDTESVPTGIEEHLVSLQQVGPDRKSPTVVLGVKQAPIS
jgi:hypothetical protein